MSDSTEFGQPALGIYGLTYQYRRGDTVLDEISIEIEQGEFAALLGPNGSGKSTFLKAVAGILPLLRPGCSGQIRYHGQNFNEYTSEERASHVAYVPPEVYVQFPLTAYETVAMGRTCQLSEGISLDRTNSEIIRSAMEKCLCWDLRNRDIHTLSGGERQLVLLARALCQGAKVLLLDEALSKMDLNHQALMGKLLKGLTRSGWTVVMVAHDVNLASEWADTAIFLKNGKKVSSGKLKDVLTEERIRGIYPGANLMLGQNPSTGAPKVFFGDVL